jgi:hypothetical protein
VLRRNYIKNSTEGPKMCAKPNKYPGADSDRI